MPKPKTIIGWREWVSLPELNLPLINAKIDTGAKTSCLHADEITLIDEDTVSFIVHPIQKNEDLIVRCKAKIVDRRSVKSSSGHVEDRYVIRSLLQLSESVQYYTDITLSNRSDMAYRMLVGRNSLSDCLVNADKSYIIRKKKTEQVLSVYETIKSND